MEVFVPIIIFYIIVMALWVLYAWLYQQYRIDKTRQELFALRDDLFDFAAAGNIPFNHPSYTLLRTTINGMIRFCHRLSLFTVILMIWAESANPQKTNFNKKLESTFSELDESVQQKLRLYYKQMHEIVAKHLILRSLSIISVVVMLLTILALIKGFRNAKVFIIEKISRRLDVVDSKASTQPLTPLP